VSCGEEIVGRVTGIGGGDGVGNARALGQSHGDGLAVGRGHDVGGERRCSLQSAAYD